LIASGLFNGAVANEPVPPGLVDHYVGHATISYDSLGNPVQAQLTLGGLQARAPYRLCVGIVSGSRPPGNQFDYGQPCRTFLPTKAAAAAVAWGMNFPWGGPAEYRATWRVPPTGPTVATATFRWTWEGSTDLSPCPPDPYLMRGVWQPARFTVENRCYRWTGQVRRNRSVAPDGDWGWEIRYVNGELRHVEYMPRDQGRLRGPCTFDCSMPSVGEIWEITGVYVCDLNHRHREFHPVFEARQIAGGTVRRTLLSGPQYSTETWRGPYPTFDRGPCGKDTSSRGHTPPAPRAGT
jgi:hypothetical protein